MGIGIEYRHPQIMLKIVPNAGPSISMVLLAYNEEESIAQAISDCIDFGDRYLSDYEVIVVDDGSSDCTSSIVTAAENHRVKLIKHKTNQGMGASMRDGYLMAEKDYIAHLPGDRQVRPDALLPMLDLVSPNHVIVSSFANPPSGQARVAMSMVFRGLTKTIGNMKVNFAGTYLFHRDWMSTLRLSDADSDTFLFSFQLLELMRRERARFSTVKIPTYPRHHGQSKEATLPRIVSMFREIAKGRIKS